MTREREPPVLSHGDEERWSFDEGAAVKYRELSRSRLRIGTLDLKIAAIVFAHDAILLSRNLSDYRKVPGLKVAGSTCVVGLAPNRVK